MAVSQARRSFLRLLGGRPAEDVTAAEQAAARHRMALANRDREGKRGAVASGVPLSGGQFGYEYVSKLKGTSKWDTLDEMANDPHIKSTLRVNAYSLLTAKWEVQPASDDPRDVEIAQFVESVLLRRSNDKFGREYWVQTSWLQRLYEILGMLEHGYAMFAKSWRVVRGKGGIRRVYDRIQWLEPSSVDPSGWQLSDTDDFEGVYRTYNKPGSKYTYGEWKTDEFIDAGRLTLYPWELRGARFEGRPFTRSMYGPWFRKDFLLKQAMIWAQKSGAPVPYGSYPSEWPDDVRDKFEDFIKLLRGTAPAEAYGMFPLGPDGTPSVVQFAGADVGEVDRMRGLIDGENLEIAHAGGTKSQMLGETGSGSRAVGSVQAKTDLLTTQAVALWICEIMTHGAGNLEGEVESLVRENYSDVQEYPRMVVSKIDPQEGLDDIPALVQAVNARLIPRHPDLMRQVTERFGLSLPDDAYEIETEPTVPPGQDAGDEKDAEDTEQADEVADDADGAEMAASARTDAFRQRIAHLLQPMEGAPQRGTFRKPNRLETEVVNLAAVQETYRVGERDVLAALRATRREITATLAGWLRGGKLNPRNLESLRQAKYRGHKRAVAMLKPVLDGIGRTGMVHVTDEIERAKGMR